MQAMQVTYLPETGRFVAKTSYEGRALPKSAGFRWDGAARQWWTADLSRAAKFAAYADDTCRETLTQAAAAESAALTASRAVDADIEVPVPEGCGYLPYQRAGIAYAMSRPATLIADEMGLGKTIQALGVINADPTIHRVLVICPASLRLNWAREAHKWLVRPLTIGFAGTAIPDTDIVVINYDILAKHSLALRACEWDLLIADEAHYLKNPKAIRTQSVLGSRDTKPIPARRRVYLTGTPILNRPIELWPLLHSMDPAAWKSWKYYVMHYCAGRHNGYGWDVSGASNLEELQDRLRATVMIRRLKKDVLTELPPKRRQIVEIAANGAADLVAAERSAWAACEERLEKLRAAAELAKTGTEDEYKAAVERLTEGARAAFEEGSKIRHEVALAKVPYVFEFVADAIEASGKVILFAHHLDVVAAIAARFADACVTLTGDTKLEDRQAAVDRFQTDPACTLFIGTIKAAGVGLTLTAASHVVFAELDWVPGNVTQAEDRAHRIGQTNSVLIQHLVLEDSIDARIARTLVRKQEVIDRALDSIERQAPVLPEKQEPATHTTRREQIERDAAELTPEQIEAIHTGLRMLAGMCDGAAALDGAGFSKIDTMIGHSLAEFAHLTPKQGALGKRLVTKYRRQLPADLLAAIQSQESADGDQ